MNVKTQISKRLRDMLTKDKLGLSDGFMTAFRSDLTHLVGDYFDLSEGVKIDVKLQEDGKYVLSITATADRINHFETTMKN
ncbi:MAG: cell division topological specificity factor MinE [Clostridia bacterium]|nr:cell division topological specificity factor MinE [Clostridia bacterium]